MYTKVKCKQLDKEEDFQLLEIGLAEFKIIAQHPFDREVKAEHVITVMCTDDGNPSLMTSTDIVVKILDVNDCAPEFPLKTYNISVAENNTVGDVLLRLNVYDCDEEENAMLVYSLIPIANTQRYASLGRASSRGASPGGASPGAASQLVLINQANGTVVAGVSLDYESLKSLTYLLLVSDIGRPALSATATLSISITDVNDNSPVFDKDSYEFSVLENQPIGREVGHVTATDDDEFPFNRFVYRIFDEEDSCSFAVDSTSGVIVTLSLLDRELQSLYRITVVAEGVAESRPLYSETSVTVRVDDVNDNLPVVQFPSDANHTVELHSRSARPGALVARILARDADERNNSRLTYALERREDYREFEIDRDSGWIRKRTTSSDLGYDPIFASLRVVVTVSDGGYPPNTVTTTMTIIINDSIDVTFNGQFDDHAMRLESERGAFVAYATIFALPALAVLLLGACLFVAAVCWRRRRARSRRLGPRMYQAVKGTHASIVFNDFVNDTNKKPSEHAPPCDCRRADVSESSPERTASMTSYSPDRTVSLTSYKCSKTRRKNTCGGCKGYSIDPRNKSEVGAAAEPCLLEVSARSVAVFSSLSKS